MPATSALPSNGSFPLPIGCSDLTPSQHRALVEIEAARDELHPVEMSVALNLLGSCLALVAPVGMTPEERDEWLGVAYVTVRDLGVPEDLLERGCAAARLKADHHSKIIPAINKEIAESLAYRKRRRANADQDFLELSAPKEEAFERCPGHVATAIVDELGLRSQPAKAKPKHIGPPRNPTDADYAEIRAEMDAKYGR